MPPPPAAIIRPKRALLRSGALGLSLVTVALFGSLYLVTVPDGSWGVVFAAQTLALIVWVFLFLRYRMSNIELADGQIISRDFPYRTERINHSTITRLLLADVYIGPTTDTYLCLYALGPANKPLLRMRTKYWEQDDVLKVAAAVDAPVTQFPQPLSARELELELELELARR